MRVPNVKFWSTAEGGVEAGREQSCMDQNHGVNDDGSDVLKSRWVTSLSYTQPPDRGETDAKQMRNRCETGAKQVRDTPDGRLDDDV